jgi:hypothetical protein
VSQDVHGPSNLPVARQQSNTKQSPDFILAAGQEEHCCGELSISLSEGTTFVQRLQPVPGRGPTLADYHETVVGPREKRWL